MDLWSTPATDPGRLVPATPEGNARLRVQLEDLLGEYDRMRDNMTTLREQLASVRGEAKTKDSLVRVTVGSRGELRALHIDPRAYRKYSPSQLAEEILELAGNAKQEVTETLESVMAPILPKGVSYSDAVTGNVNLSQWPQDRPLTADALREWWEGIKNSGLRPQEGSGS